jgi:hypothetical protein
MAADIQVTYPQQLIKISSVTLLDEEVPTLEIIGDDFSAVDEVLLNDIQSPEVVILSKTRLTAVIPEEVRGQQIVNVVVVSYRTVFSQGSVVSFRVGGTNRKTSGISRLVQLFLKVLLSTPGSDIFNKTLGGGALRNVGKSFSRTNSGSIVSDFVISVDTTVKQIIAAQARQPRLPRDERLLSAKVTSARFDAEQTALVVSIELYSQAGTSATANILI